MKVNPKARIEIMHSARGLQTIQKTWSGIGFDWLGANNPLLPKILKELHETGVSHIKDASGTTSLRALDKMYLP
jgi:hypothetical protein